MSLTVNTLTYENDTARTPDSFRYTGPSHTLSNRDYIDVKRVAPKPTADYAGQGKSAVKLTRDMESSVTAGTIVGGGLLDLSLSVPVESITADQEALINDLGTWLLTAEAKDVLLNHDIVQ